MHSALDFSSWQALLSTLLGIAVFSLVAIGIRLLVMQTVQQRRERENRQINERLRTLIAAYKTLGGSFTGNLLVDPTHWRDLRMQGRAQEAPASTGASDAVIGAAQAAPAPYFERRRRVRDAVEAALSDIILLGTEEQVRLAVAAANDMLAGRPVETASLVVALRTFIREVLDLDPMPAELAVPKQGPLRPGSAGRGERDDRAGNRAGAGGRGGAEGAGGAGAGAAAGLGVPRALEHDHGTDSEDPAAR